jgi:uncharacterized protein YjbI with pentapeptide repeats
MDISFGRAPFETRPVDRDYSGLSIADRYLSAANIEKSFFNGVNFINCVFEDVRLNNTEFSEAKAERCAFIRSDLTGSDFVDCLFEGILFEHCNFEKGEWREAVFKRCKFVDCNLDHTTVTLCSFIGCEFDTPSLATAVHRAIYYNVFSHCAFERPMDDAHFSSRNFGVRSTAVGGAVVPAGADITIEQMCLLNNVGHLRAIDVANVAEVICEALGAGGHRRNSSLVFYSKVVRVLTDERRLSSTTLIYLEQVITRFAANVSDQDLFTTAMAAIVEIRSALFAVASETSPSDGEAQGFATQITIRFDESYTRRQAEIFRDALVETAGIPPNGLVIESVHSGSTLIEMASGVAISAGGLLFALNFILRQAKIAIQNWDDLKKTAIKVFTRRRKAPERRRTPRSKRAKLPAVMQTGPVLRELAPVRAAVRKNGKVLVEMDEPAHVRISVQYMDRGGK